MITIRPFAALRPKPELVGKIAAPPYDVLSSEEARAILQTNPYSFLQVTKPEATLPVGTDQYADITYAQGPKNFAKVLAAGWFEKESKPSFYLYKQYMGKHQQLGLVAGASTLDYEQDRIKKHELTREEKEVDRMRHIEGINAQAGSVFLTYRAVPAIDKLFASLITGKPLYDFTDDMNVRHQIWRVDDEAVIARIQNEFAKLDRLYVADGHHRSAVATRISIKRRNANPNHTGNEEYNFFLSVIFPHNQMNILPYNRVVKEIPMGEKGFLAQLAEKFVVEDAKNGNSTGVHDFRLFINSKWHKLTPKSGLFDATDPVACLDVDILQKNVLAPMLGIDNPRTSKKIDFVGGIRGTAELIKLVNSGEFALAFSLYPVTIEQLMAIADAGKIMPPKSTWFEPKLKSGLTIHTLD